MIRRCVDALPGVGHLVNDAAIQMLLVFPGHGQKFEPVAIPTDPANNGSLNAECMTLVWPLQTELNVKTGGHGPVVFDGAALNGHVDEKSNAHRGSCNEEDRIMNGDAIVKPGILAERPATGHARHCIPPV